MQNNLFISYLEFLLKQCFSLNSDIYKVVAITTKKASIQKGLIGIKKENLQIHELEIDRIHQQTKNIILNNTSGTWSSEKDFGFTLEEITKGYRQLNMIEAVYNNILFIRVKHEDQYLNYFIYFQNRRFVFPKQLHG